MKKTTILILLFLTANVFSQTLTSEEIVQKYIDALGGVKELKKMQRLTMTGKATSGGNTYTLFAHEDYIDKFQFAQVSGDGYDVKTYFDTTNGWTTQNGIKSSLSKETIERLQPNIEDGTYFYLGDMKLRGITTQLIGEERIGGRDAYKIKFIRNGNDKNIQYIDKETFYVVKIETPGFNSVEFFYGDYREVPGTSLTLPFYNEKGGIKASISEYKINVPMDSSLLSDK